MAFNFRPFDTQSHTIVDGLCNRRSVEPMIMREAIRRELEKEIIREEILAEEIERRRRELTLEREMTRVSRIGGFLPALGLGQHLPDRRYQFEPEMLRYGEPFPPERCDGSGIEAVPLQRRPPSTKIQTFTVDRLNADKKEMIGLGQPCGSKRKAPSPPTTLKGDFSCSVCGIKVTSAHSLKEHFAGKKHLAMTNKIMMGNKKGKKHH